MDAAGLAFSAAAGVTETGAEAASAGPAPLIAETGIDDSCLYKSDADPLAGVAEGSACAEEGAAGAEDSPAAGAEDSPAAGAVDLSSADAVEVSAAEDAGGGGGGGGGGGVSDSFPLEALAAGTARPPVAGSAEAFARAFGAGAERLHGRQEVS